MRCVWVCKHQNCGWYEFDLDSIRKYYLCPDCGRFMNRYDESDRIYQELYSGAMQQEPDRRSKEGGNKRVRYEITIETEVEDIEKVPVFRVTQDNLYLPCLQIIDVQQVTTREVKGTK